MSFDRSLLAAPSYEVAPLLLGAVLTVSGPDGTVSLRITETEAYHGSADPGSHAFRGKTARNAVMFGEAGHLYTYFTYGMHTCANVVCGPEGQASGLLLRAGQIVDGVELARSRRPTSRKDADLARGPARLTVAAGITLADGGADLGAGRIRLDGLGGGHPFSTGPRTGVSGPGGGIEFPWRFWITGDPTVSPYKAHAPKRKP
jgi:DNA-3-methyladenine glycosylase